MTLPEINSLFQSGKAELDGRAALTAAAFASAIIQRGIDSGIQEFRSFTLMVTTSEKTFESRLGAVVSVPSANPVISEATRRIVALRDRLPIDTEGTKKRYRGVQGPVDHALLGLAETVGQGPLQTERSWQLIDAVFEALAKVDRNRSYRESGVSFERLPLAWLSQLLSQSHEQLIEMRIALALASLRSEIPKGTSKASAVKLPQPFIAYRLGVTGSRLFWQIPKDVPLRRIWSPAGAEPNLVALAKRRLIETPARDAAPFRSSLSASISDALHLLNGHTDDQAIAIWLDRFSLFDWSEQRAAKEPLRAWLTATTPEATAIQPEHFSYAFLRPHFDSDHLTATAALASGKRFDRQPKLVAKSGRLSGIVAALDAGNPSTAWDRALASYRAERIPIADFSPDLFHLSNPQRLLAALSIPVGFSGMQPLIRRWLSPTTHNQPETHP
jgi:CRISPR-associated protein Csx17